MRLKIAGGRLFDPAGGWDGEVGDLFIRDGRIVAEMGEADTVIEARGQVVAPAGIELRGQAATYGLDFLRLTNGVPSLQELGESYALLGYTHVHEPLLTAWTAGYVQRQLAGLPVVDTSASLVLNLRELDLWLNSPEHLREIGQTLNYLLEATRSLNFRVVEPFVRYRQDVYVHRSLDLDRTLEVLADLARATGPRMILEASPEVLRAGLPEPAAFHLAALGPALTDDDLAAAALALLAAGATGDLGLMSAQPQSGAARLPVRIDLGWYRALDLNPPPDEAAARRALTLALDYQGAGLAFSGAGPALAPVAGYPRMFAWLGDRAARRQDWGEDLGAREYSLSEWLWATRTLPARLLGLTDRGRLSPGARADVAIYDLPAEAPHSQWQRSLGRCRTLLKAGEVVVDNFSLVNPEVARATYYRRTGAEATPMLAEICQFQSRRWENLWVPAELGGPWVGL
ncbi:MAG: amidohydrolase family protein [Syntrophobacterales bacterium]|jgi:formylmethanofuran dehydrogenase subunit A|nr:amidohydrolase family protein [Syntrophobacterales bacterium]